MRFLFFLLRNHKVAIYLIFTTLYNHRSILKNKKDSYLKANGVRIELNNVIENLGQPEEHTKGGLRLKLECKDAGSASIRK